MRGFRHFHVAAFVDTLRHALVQYGYQEADMLHTIRRLFGAD